VNSEYYFKSNNVRADFESDWSKTPTLRPFRVEQSEKAGEAPAGREGLVPFQFRFVSVGLIQDNYLDWTEQALKGVVSLFRDITLFANHEKDVTKWMGITGKTWWEGAVGDIPPGINGIIWIDEEQARSNGNLIRGLELGAIHSVSISAYIDVLPSHPNMQAQAFMDKLGETVDGDVVRLIVQRVREAVELSLVWQGADRHARALPESRRTVIQSLFNQAKDSGGNEKMEILERIALTLGIPKDEVKEDRIPELIQDAVKKEAVSLTGELTQKVSDLEKTGKARDAEVVELKKTVEALSVKAKVGETWIEQLKKETEALYKLSVDSPEERVLKVIQESESAETLQGYAALYRPIAEQKAPLRCVDCGSTNVSRQASQAAKPPDSEREDGSLEKQRDTSFLDRYYPKDEE